MGVVGVVVQEVASGANIVQLVNDCTSYQRLGELSASFASTVAGFRVAPSNDGVRELSHANAFPVAVPASFIVRVAYRVLYLNVNQVYVAVFFHVDDLPFEAQPVLERARAVLLATCNKPANVTCANLRKKQAELTLAFRRILHQLDGEPALSGKLSDVFLTCEGGADDAAMALDGVHAFNCNDLKVSSDLATQAWKNHTQIAQKLRDLVVPLDTTFLAHTPFHVASAMDLISFDPYPKLDLGDAFTFDPALHACKHAAGDEAGGSVANAVAHVGTTAKDSPVSDDDGVDSDDYGGGGSDATGTPAASTTTSQDATVDGSLSPVLNSELLDLFTTPTPTPTPTPAPAPAAAAAAPALATPKSGGSGAGAAAAPNAAASWSPFGASPSVSAASPASVATTPVVAGSGGVARPFADANAGGLPQPPATTRAQATAASPKPPRTPAKSSRGKAASTKHTEGVAKAKVLVSETVTVAFVGDAVKSGACTGAIAMVIDAPATTGVLIKAPASTPLSLTAAPPVPGGVVTASAAPPAAGSHDARVLVKSTGAAAKPVPLAKYSLTLSAPSSVPVKINGSCRIHDAAVEVLVRYSVRPGRHRFTSCKLRVMIPLDDTGEVASTVSKPAATWKAPSGGLSSPGQLLWSLGAIAGGDSGALRAKLTLATPYAGEPLVKTLRVQALLAGTVGSAAGVAVLARGVSGSAVEAQVQWRCSVKASFQ